MITITAAAVQQLRARTGVSILACKDALEEAQGNEEKAIEILRKRGIAQAAKKAARDQSEGLVFFKEGAGKAAVLLLKCETDFVARDATFSQIGEALVATLHAKGEDAMKQQADQSLPAAVQKLGENIALGESKVVSAPVLGTYRHTNAKIGVIVGLEGGTVEMARDVAMHAAAMSPLYVQPDEVPAATVEKEKEIWREQLKKEAKPEAMWDKIMMGKEKKFREENALMKQVFVKDQSKKVEQYLGSAKVVAYARIAVG